MTIDPRIARAAKHFGIDPALIQAVVQAEGGINAILRAVRASLPNTKSTDEAIEITCRSAAHALSDFVRYKHADAFVRFWATRWAPLGAPNDPTNLNANWPGNVLSNWPTQPRAPDRKT